MSFQKAQPIGIFDSGIGGLTLARAVQKLLPGENIVYFGDTAHLPYGEKSNVAIQSYSVKICDWLIHQHACKCILIACNSASAAAFELAQAYTGSKAHVLNVIDPVVAMLKERHTGKTVGLIGTRATVNSGAYLHRVEALDAGIVLKSKASPLLASAIEEGFYDNPVSRALVNEYLSDPILKDIEALVLACTHYPLIKKEVEAFYGGSTEVIDTTDTVARALKAYLLAAGLINEGTAGQKSFYVSDFTASFQAAAKMFFQEEIVLKKHALWE